MKPFCEAVVQEVLPKIRAMIAKELVEKHGLTQESAAKKLGTTQPAVSHYLREMRASKVSRIEKDSEIESMVKEMAEEAVKGGDISVKKICELCKTVRRKKLICSSCSGACDSCFSFC